MTYRFASVAFAVLLSAGMAACVGQAPQSTVPAPIATPMIAPPETPAPAGTSTATPTAAATATSTATLSPTSTPTPSPPPTRTATPTATATLPRAAAPAQPLADRQTVAEGGFSVRPPANYDVKIKGTQLSAFARDKYLWITLVGVPGNPLARTPRELALGGIDILFGNASGGYKIIDEAAATIGGKPAFALGFAGTLSGEAVEGRAAGVTASSTQVLIIIGYARVGDDAGAWKREGDPLLNAMAGTISFASPMAAGAATAIPAKSACPIATDKTYGHTKENPIRIGNGNPLDGPSRERAFLDTLLGPAGERLSYVRGRSAMGASQILDVYTISGLKTSVDLYIDMYTWAEPMAPVGFICASAFPLRP